MNTSEAKKILLLYRPGTADEKDPSFAAALAEVEHNPELKAWFENHCRFQIALKRKFAEIPTPAGGKERILTEPPKIIRPAFPQWTRNVLAAAAVLIFLGVLGSMILKPKPRDRFSDYRGRMVQDVLRAYSMDLRTNNMRAVREYMLTNGAPADYSPPAPLGGITLAGGGVLRWRGNPVSMICYDRGASNMVWLFVIKQSAAKDAPGPSPEFQKVHKLTTASWSQGPNSYIVAAELPEAELRKYL